MSAPGRIRDDRQAILILCLLLTGVIATASIIPFMSVYIVKGLGEPPWKISLYISVVTITTLAANRQFGERIDGGTRIAPLILISLAAFAIANIAILIVQEYWVLLAIAALCFGISNASVSSMYSLGRLYADQNNLPVDRYNAGLRAMTSLGWMIAPALSFLIADRFGYTSVFRTSLGLAALWALLWWLAMPKTFSRPPVNAVSDSQATTPNTGLWLSALMCFFFALAHVLCTGALPLFYLQDVGMPGFSPGLSFSIKTGVEIIAILLAPWLVTRFGARHVLMSTAAIALVAFWQLSIVQTLPQMFVGAAIEGLYYGLFAGVGIGYIQSFARGRIARATSLYMNSLFLGGLLGGALMGLIAQAFDFGTAIQLASFGALGAFCALVALGRFESARAPQ